MYNGFGAYPSDDMGMGVNSYFGESDANFFGDTSDQSFFGEGSGFNADDTFDTNDFSMFNEASLSPIPREDKTPTLPNKPGEPKQSKISQTTASVKKPSDSYDTIIRHPRYTGSGSGAKRIDDSGSGAKRIEPEERAKKIGAKAEPPKHMKPNHVEESFVDSIDSLFPNMNDFDF